MTGPPRTQHPPLRAAHLGLGAFHRAHQAWYTQQANDRAVADDGWGIAAFTGRAPEAAELLSRNDGAYTVLERSAEGDRATTVQSIVRAIPGSDEASWLDVLADPQVAVLTVTVTEAGYSAGSGVPRRIAEGLVARAEAGAGSIAVVSCDNLSRNGRVLRDAVRDAAGAEAGRISDIASFVDTVVDRITPAVTAADIVAVRELTGFDDPSAVVTEPYSEWILAGGFPGGTPDWVRAGARFVEDVGPYEARKLSLLNAGHSFLAAAGRLRGYETIAEAFDDAGLRADTEASGPRSGRRSTCRPGSSTTGSTPCAPASRTRASPIDSIRSAATARSRSRCGLWPPSGGGAMPAMPSTRRSCTPWTPGSARFSNSTRPTP